MTAEDVLMALAAPQRQRILELVRDQPLSAGDIARECGSSQQAVSHHLQVLKSAGLVEVRPDGRRRLYLVDPDGFESVSALMATLWPKGLARLQAVIEDKQP